MAEPVGMAMDGGDGARAPFQPTAEEFFDFLEASRCSSATLFMVWGTSRNIRWLAESPSPGGGLEMADGLMPPLPWIASFFGAPASGDCGRAWREKSERGWACRLVSGSEGHSANAFFSRAAEAPSSGAPFEQIEPWTRARRQALQIDRAMLAGRPCGQAEGGPEDGAQKPLKTLRSL